jgi:probable F420-dependent oxidoreductase
MLGNGTTGLYVDVVGSGPVAAVEFERLGYDAVWLAGGRIDTLDRIGELIDATGTVRVVPGIIALGVHDDDAIASLYAQQEVANPGRLVLGLGGPQQAKPMAALSGHLDALDAAGVPIQGRLLAALGQRKTQVARDRCAGAITLLTDPQSTAATREILGDGPTLAVNQIVVLDSDPARARDAVRGTLGFLVGVGGYRANFDRMGFTDAEIDGLSDRLVDAVSVWGDVEHIAARVDEHRAAGADHVALKLMDTSHSPPPFEAAELLAHALGVSAHEVTK